MKINKFTKDESADLEKNEGEREKKKKKKKGTIRFSLLRWLEHKCLCGIW